MALRKRKPQAPAGRIAVTTYSGRPIIDPPPEVIGDLILAIVDDPDELVGVSQVADDETYVQVARLSDGRWVVESRGGSEDTHAHAFVADATTAVAIVLAWTAGDDTWRTAADWQDGYP